MIRRNEECTVETRDAMRNGPGSVKITNIADKAELLNKSRMFGEIVLEPNCGIGLHEHKNESEIFYITEGEAIYNDNGTENPVKAGDVTICPSGESHAITNVSDKVCRLIALIVLE